MQTVDKAPKPNQNTTAMRIIGMVVAFCIPLSLALVLHGTLFGYSPGEQSDEQTENETIREQGASQIINTSVIGVDISGYGGPVPVEIFVTHGVIDSVKALPNSESPKFFSKLKSEGLTTAWNGKTLKEAAAMEVDGITGATYSSRAFIANVRAGAAYAGGGEVSAPSEDVPVVGVAAILVILAGAIIPLFVHKPAYRLAQQILNVGVLGFWGGTFIDYAMMIGFFAGKPHFSLAFVITVLLLVVGFIYPAVGRPAQYCSWICPFGSLQELAGKIGRKKWKLSPGLVRKLDRFRQALWCVLLLLLYSGLLTGWIDYEIFTAFIVQSASWIVIIVGVIFIVLSLFVNRPFCRFVCPTGTLLKDA